MLSMKKPLLIALLAVSTTLSTPLYAATSNTSQGHGFFGNAYMGLSGDALWLSNIDSNNSATGETGNIDTKMLWGANAQLGYLMPSMGAFRFELEGGYHRAEL